ncbi:oxygen-independent coproporphyrinogen III oxidase [Marinobacteraceae bacterium S3BR75-40.1]
MSDSNSTPFSRHAAKPLWDERLIRRYNVSGPRYTSYPTALEFSEAYTPLMLAADAAFSQESGSDLSLYVHLPFCAHLCYYCACNKIITKKRERARPYVERVLQEAALKAPMFGPQRPVRQLHWGGGTPTFLPHEDMRLLMDGLRQQFNLATDDDRDFSIEIDPRELREDTLEVLKELGFNRVSLGVQDLNPKVQEAVHRIQPREMTEAVLAKSRELGFRSINIDLIYGLPHQTLETFAETLEAIIAMAPDRLSVFNYAHLPDRFQPQTRIRAEDLPPPDVKLQILEYTIARLTQAGYQYIGMDHFALPEDSLAVAQRKGELHRNFQGYTTHGDCDLVALGVSAIGQTDEAYFQNHHTLEDWDRCVANGELPLVKGVRLTRDDRIRRWVIKELCCQFAIDYDQFQAQWNEPFTRYFQNELGALQRMAQDGLLTLENNRLQVLAPGRLLIRVIAQTFDSYRQEQASSRFSRII